MIRQNTPSETIKILASRPFPPVRLGGPLAFTLTPRHVWGLWLVTRVVMLANLIIGQHYCDPQFYQYAGDFATGHLPYLNVPVEYPPVALFLIILPALPLLPFSAIAPRPDANPFPLHPDPVRYGAYGISFALMMVLIDAATLHLVMRVARRWTPRDSSGLWSGLLYVGLIFASGTLMQKFDLATGTLCLLAVFFMLERRDGWAWATLVLGTMIKGYPILLAPLFILWRLPNLHSDWQALRRAAVGATIASVATIGPILLAAGMTPLVHSILYHTSRGTEIESTWGTLILALAWVPGLHAVSLYNPADLSRDITSALNVPLDWLATPLLVAGCVGIYVLLWRRLHMKPGRALQREFLEQTGNVAPASYLVQASTVVILLFALCFRAMPAHYLLGVLPLVAVLRLPGRANRLWLGLLIGGLIVGQLVVTLWVGLITLQPGPAALMIARNVLLVVASIVLVRAPAIPRWKPSDGRSTERIG